MARLARPVIPGYPHQVTQRGNYNQVVFEESDDYRRYLDWLHLYTSRYGLDIWAYCLIENHVHFVCIPKDGDSLARTFNTLHMRYAQYFNAKRDLSGHLWKGRFLSCALDPKSTYEEVRHIENNPVRYGLVDRAEDYPWSSAQCHVLGTSDPLLSDACSLTSEIEDWRAYLAQEGDASVVCRTRERLKTGRPAGDIAFLKELESVTGRLLSPRPRGRPRKVKLKGLK